MQGERGNSPRLHFVSYAAIAGRGRLAPNAGRGRWRCSVVDGRQAGPAVGHVARWRQTLAARLAWLRREVDALAAVIVPGSEVAGLMAARYDALPEAVKGEAQMLGRLSPGCEGTHGVFPRCNFRCVPCYHGAEANRVPTDGAHTAVEVARQMAALQQLRGPVAHAQLIGGEVSLLGAADHAHALEVMRFYGRIPMSFTHGDFDYAYLRRLAVREGGGRRFARLDFAAHFDRYMYGRRGAVRPASERALNRHRARFAAMFGRLRRETGVHAYLAHNMTVQQGNVGEVVEVVRALVRQPWRMASFQPAAAQGARRAAGVDADAVWAEVERGAGVRLPWRLFQMGHAKCNRVCLTAVVGDRVVPFFDDRCAGDARVRDVMIRHFGNIVLRPVHLYIKAVCVVLRRPWLLAVLVGWVWRFARRAGWDLLRRRSRLCTFVMHTFMDGDQVRDAWALMAGGDRSDSAAAKNAGKVVAETMERLEACSYGMAQVESERIVPACVQHAVFDEAENRKLALELGVGGSDMPNVNTASE